MLYQICILNKATRDNPATVNQTALVRASSMTEASRIAERTHKRSTFRVYPYCTAQDGEGQMELARYALYSFEKWERQFNASAMNEYSRNEYDREDLIATAYLAINVLFAENPSADMHTLKTAVFSAIATEQRRNQRRAEREFNPDFIACNIAPRTAKATFPALDRLTRKAVETADMTEKQMQVLNMAYQDGQGAQDIANELNISRACVYRSLYRAYYKVLAQMVELDRDLRAFTEAGYTAEDIDEMQTILRKRAGW